MNPSRRLLLAAGLVVGSLSAQAPSFAQAWPDKPIHMVVTFAAGGGTDNVARVIAPKLSQALGQSVVVENRPGAGGLIGTAFVAKAPADGYTVLLAAAGPTTIAPNVFDKDKVTFDPMKDLLPIALVATAPFVVTVNPSVPARTLPELIAYAKANPDKLNFGSSGNGGSPHLAGELFKRMAGVQMQHVPYKGLAPAITDLMGGQIQVVFADVGLVTSQIKAGKLRALAVTGDQRYPALPDVPTVAEAGVPGYRAATWYGLIAPAGVPDAVRDRLSTEMRRIIAMPDVREQLAARGNDVPDMTMQQFGALVGDDYTKWRKLVQDLGGVQVN
ncbi:MAG: Bug family tripartite tricarboxylate transporter substrate binding protein [Lautropia sp.]